MNKYIGNKNHKLTCLYFVKKEKNVNYYMFECECGKHKIINPIKVFGKNSSTKSCGCLRKEKCSLLGLRNNNITLSIEKTQKRSYYKYR